MKIKLAILDNDVAYLRQLCAALESRFADSLDVSSFEDPEEALKCAGRESFDLFLSGTELEPDISRLPEQCGFAWLSEDNCESLGGRPAVFKYQRVDAIVTRLQALYIEAAGVESGLRNGSSKTKLLAFSSPCGGCGNSVVAAACANRLAAGGKKVLYLNLERFGSAELYFSGRGTGDMTTVISALRSRQAGLTDRITACLRTAANGVSFFAPAKQALDMMKLTADDVVRLLSVLSAGGRFDCILLDVDFMMDRDLLTLFSQCHTLVWVGDGSEPSNWKLGRVLELLRTLDQKSETALVPKLRLIYNRFGSRTGKKLDADIPVLGGSPRYDRATTAQVVERLSTLEFFDQLI